MTVHEIDAERIVLGAMMQDASVIPRVREKLDRTDFWEPNHATVFAAIIKNHEAGEPTEPVAVTRRLADSGDIRGALGAAFLHDLYAAGAAAAMVPYYVNLVAQAAYRRRVKEAADRVKRLIDTSADTAQLAAALAELAALGASDRYATTGRPPLKFLTIKELRAKVAAAGPRKWLLRGFWPDGDYGVFAGDMKAQKTWTFVDAVVSAASGTPWLGLVPVERTGAVVMFVGEGGDADILRRIDAVCADRGLCADDLPIVVCTRAPNLSDDAHLGLMADRLDAVRPILTGIDPLYLSAGGANGADLYAMGRLLIRPQQLCQDIGSSLIITTHQNRKEGRGAARITGAGPAEWGRVLMTATVISRNRDKATTETTVISELDVIGGSVPGGRLRIVRRIVADNPDDLGSPLKYSVECTEVTDGGESDKASGLPPAVSKVLNVLTTAAHPLSNQEIGDAVKAKYGHGLTRPTISKACAALVSEGIADELDGTTPGGAKRWMTTAHP